MTINNIINTNEFSFDRIIKKSTKPVVVIFYANWCKPCQEVKPILEQLSLEIKELLFIRLDIDENKSLAQKLNIQTVPNITLYKNADMITTIDARDKDSLANEINKFV